MTLRPVPSPDWTSADILHQSILKKDFPGKLVPPQNPNDEPALELLKRIKAERKKAKSVRATGRSPGRGRRR
jgi:hypothetical protein